MKYAFFVYCNELDDAFLWLFTMTFLEDRMNYNKPKSFESFDLNKRHGFSNVIFLSKLDPDKGGESCVHRGDRHASNCYVSMHLRYNKIFCAQRDAEV